MFRKGVLTKSQGLRVHSKRQAYRRYGILLNSDDLRRLVESIQSQEALFIVRKTHRVSCWKVTYCGCGLVVLYDRGRKEIITFLPPDCREIRAFEARKQAPSLGLYEPHEEHLNAP